LEIRKLCSDIRLLTDEREFMIVKLKVTQFYVLFHTFCVELGIWDVCNRHTAHLKCQE